MEKLKEMSQKTTSKIIGIIPARMAASRFPGKPLKSICGAPMIRHVIERSKLYNKWSSKVHMTRLCTWGVYVLQVHTWGT